jgi:hypothetical protein
MAVGARYQANGLLWVAAAVTLAALALPGFVGIRLVRSVALLWVALGCGFFAHEQWHDHALPTDYIGLKVMIPGLALTGLVLWRSSSRSERAPRSTLNSAPTYSQLNRFAFTSTGAQCT